MPDHESVFDWESLPTELQDWALDYMAASKPIKLKTPHRNFFQLLLHNAPEVNLLLVSRSFGKQYSKRVKRLSNLSFRDHRQCEFNVPAVPKELEQYPLSCACLLAFRHNTISDIDRHVAWLQRTVADLKAKAVEVKLYCETDGDDGLNLWPESSKHDRLKEKLIEMVAIEGIESVEVFWYDGTPESQTVSDLPSDDDGVSEEVRKNVDEVLEGPQNLVETWTRADGWRLHNECPGGNVGAERNVTAA